LAQLIDSSVLIGMERRGLQVEQIGEVTQDSDGAISSITASELLVGVFRSDSPERRQNRETFVQAVIDAFPVVPFEIQAARAHARLSADLLAGGHSVAAHDLMIAATALNLGYAVLTENARDFARVPGLAVERPNWP
jgi:tRNA(fMet)-specific endonuclease VapC